MIDGKLKPNNSRATAVAYVILVAAGALIFYWLIHVTSSITQLRENAARFDGVLTESRQSRAVAIEQIHSQLIMTATEQDNIWSALRRVEAEQAAVPIDELMRRIAGLENVASETRNTVYDLKVDIAKIVTLIEERKPKKEGAIGS